MKIGIMQPYFLPYIGYWQLLNFVDKYVIYDDVNYIKGGWIARNKILLNKKEQLFGLKLISASSNKLINEIEITEDEIHIEKLLKTIRLAYKKAPYYDFVYPIIEEILVHKEKKLSKFIIFSLKKICNYLEIKTELIVSSDLEKNNRLKSQEKVIEICKLLNGDEYYNAMGGKALYSYKTFSENGIILKFLESRNINYKQYDNIMISNLSILDMMMFNSIDKIKEMLLQYYLIGEEN